MFDKKPLLFGNEETTIDEAAGKLEDGEIRDFYDPSSVPGHAEQVMANEIESSEAMSASVKEGYYRRFGTGPTDLEADFRWVRTQGPDGKRSYNADVAAMQYRRDGYRPATVEDLNRLGFGMPVAAQILPDGSIQREDTALFIVDGDRARKNEAERLQRNREVDDLQDEKGQHGQDIWKVEEEREVKQVSHD
jgi:hypothetical protein